MMDESLQQGKIKQFMNDKAMSQAVFDVLFGVFTAPLPSEDVSYLASDRIAINRLHKAWKELEHYRTKIVENERSGGQIGL